MLKSQLGTCLIDLSLLCLESYLLFDVLTKGIDHWLTIPVVHCFLVFLSCFVG